MSDTLPGVILTEGEAYRDAIHIAVAPVKASQKLSPGQHIGFVESDNETVGTVATHIGIVDPYLKVDVEVGQHFYMFLYPRTITSLHHNWTHPAFDGPPPAPAQPVNMQQRRSEEWLREFANRYDIGFEELVDNCVSGEGCHFGNDIDYADFGANSELWMHIEIYSGTRLSVEHRLGTHFSCAC